MAEKNCRFSTSSLRPEARNPGLEAVRGFAALVVVINHVIVIPGVGTMAGSGVMLLNWGVEAVVVFFLLSGTVIRLSIDHRPMSSTNFLWTRAARLLPLYLPAVVLAVAVLYAAGRPPSAWTVAGNFLFLQTLQNFLCAVLDSNLPLWSLSFEVFFYVVFALTIGRWQKALLWIWAIASAAAMATQFAGPTSGWFGHLQLVVAFSGIWLLGYFVPDLANRLRISYGVAWAWFGLLPMAARVSFGEDFYLASKHFLVAITIVPLFIVMIRKRKNQSEQASPLQWPLWALAYVGVAALMLSTGKSPLMSKVVFALMPCLTITVGMTIFNPRLTLRRFTPFALILGQLSYALYLFHYPLFFSAQSLGISGALGLVVLVPSAFALAYFCEWHVHPGVRSLLFPVRRKVSV